MIHEKITTDDLQSLPKTSWEGYAWNSDAAKPLPFSKTDTVDFDAILNELPFVVEGYLYNDVEKISITIRHFNGTYYLYKTSGIKTDTHPTQVHQVNTGIFEDTIKGLRFLYVYGEVPSPIDSEQSTHTFLHQTFIGYERAL